MRVEVVREGAVVLLEVEKIIGALMGEGVVGQVAPKASRQHRIPGPRGKDLQVSRTLIELKSIEDG